jgi:hypothetical protein
VGWSNEVLIGSHEAQLTQGIGQLSLKPCEGEIKKKG